MDGRSGDAGMSLGMPQPLPPQGQFLTANGTRLLTSQSP